MTSGGVPVGICKVQFDPVCGNTPNGEPHVSCNVVNIDRNTRVEESAPIDIAGGTPGQKCFYLEQPNSELPPEVIVDTCTGIDPVLNSITGQLTVTNFDPETGQPDPAGLGYLMQALKGETNCLCACADEGVACINRVAMTVWRMHYCFGTDGQIHPAGKYWIDHYPALEYQKTAQTSTASNSADDGERFLFYAYTNPGYTGPGNIIPVAAAEYDYNGCYYGFPTNICPPGDCGCGSCDGTDTPEPLALTTMRQSTVKTDDLVSV